MMCNIVPQTTKWWRDCRRGLTHIEVEARILVAVPSWEAPRRSLSLSLLMGLSHGNRGSQFNYVEPYLRWWCLLSAMLSSYGQRWISTLSVAITHWTEYAKGLQSGLTICAQPRRILARE